MDKAIHTVANTLNLLGYSHVNVAHNLANINTAGFMRDDDLGSEAFYLSTENSFEARVLSVPSGFAVNMTQGRIDATNKPMDLAIMNEDGFMLGMDHNDAIVLTKRGDLSVSSDGMLQNGDNIVIQGDSGPIVVPDHTDISIASDGRIWTSFGNEDPVNIGRIALVRLPEAGILKRDDGQIIPADGKIPDLDAEIEVLAGHLQTSNVNVFDTLVRMNEISHLHDANVKFLGAVDKINEYSMDLMRNE